MLSLVKIEEGHLVALVLYVISKYYLQKFQVAFMFPRRGFHKMILCVSLM